MVKDLDIKYGEWDLSSRGSIYDQLYNLCFTDIMLKSARSWKEIRDVFPPTQIFSGLKYSPDGSTNLITFSHLPCNNATAKTIFDGNGINGPEKQGVWVTRIQHATDAFPDASRNISPAETNEWKEAWKYDSNNLVASWNIQPNVAYKITLKSPPDAPGTSGTVNWSYNVVNVGDYVSMRINTKIHNDNPKINTNTININYICLVDQELSDYCGIPKSSNRGFKQNHTDYYTTDKSTSFNSSFNDT
jgi:hypothetical protein